MKNTKYCPDCTTPLASSATFCEVCGWSEFPEPQQKITDVLPVFLPMSGGTFMMGSAKTEVGRDPDEDLHPKTVNAFWIANVEVTQQLYALVTKQNPATDKHPLKPMASITWWEAIIFCNELSDLLGYDLVYTNLDTRHPIAHLNHNGFRLPTEAEWEWMAKHHTKDIPPHQQETNWSTTPTNPKKPNLQWVLGNVWEMCWDLYTPYLKDSKAISEDISPMARVVRGGSWVDGMDIFRPANRAFIDPSSRTDTIGFRLVRSTLFGSHSTNRI